MALRRKLREVADFRADVLVLQECSRADAALLESIGLKLATWTGNNPNKGLALAAKPDLGLQAKPIRGMQWGIQGQTRRGSTLGIVAVWACATENSSERYIRQVHKLLDRGILKKMPRHSVLLGDLNSNTIWDRMHRELNHSRVVEKFALAGFTSAYHVLHQELQGKESVPTFYLHRDKKKPYHIDYAFLSTRLSQVLKRIDIGSPKAWLHLSDHMPFSIEFRRSGQNHEAR